LFEHREHGLLIGLKDFVYARGLQHRVIPRGETGVA
jgi:hypothetical protein